MSQKRGFEEETHPILGPLEKHARGLQEEAHQDASAEISVPRGRHTRHFQQETRQGLGSTSSGAALSLKCVSPMCLCVCVRVCFWQAGAVLAVRSKSMDSHCVIGFKAHVLSCRSFPAPVSSVQERSSKYVRTFRSHSNTSSIFYPYHPYQHTSKLYWIRSTRSVVSHIVASTIILQLSDITFVSLPKYVQTFRSQ